MKQVKQKRVYGTLPLQRVNEKNVGFLPALTTP